MLSYLYSHVVLAKITSPWVLISNFSMCGISCVTLRITWCHFHRPQTYRISFASASLWWEYGGSLQCSKQPREHGWLLPLSMFFSLTHVLGMIWKEGSENVILREGGAYSGMGFTIRHKQGRGGRKNWKKLMERAKGSHRQEDFPLVAGFILPLPTCQCGICLISRCGVYPTHI